MVRNRNPLWVGYPSPPSLEWSYSGKGLYADHPGNIVVRGSVAVVSPH